MKIDIKKFWHEKPLGCILIGALIIRLIAAVFSQGYGMHDDHFLVLEASQSFVNNSDYNNWLPSETNTKPAGHSWTYVGLHYFFLLFLEKLGIFSPYVKMLLIRIIHALFSLLVPYFSYKITEKLSNKKNAIQVGLLMAFFWIMPFFSVRNLVEIVAIPFLLMVIWFYLKSKDKSNPIPFLLLSGLMVGITLSIRFQTAFFIVGFGLALITKREFKSFIFIVLASLLTFSLTQGLVDFLIWGRPFAEFQEYVMYNIEHKLDYLTAPWYLYILFLSGILIPPISLFILFGFIKSYKKYWVIFLGTFLFLAFHSYFPNKQERFILSILPFIIILGNISWNDFVEKSKFWNKNPKLLKSFWIFFWTLNILVMLPLSVTFSKKSQVEAMQYLYNAKQFDYFIVEESQSESTRMLPRFYCGKYCTYFEVTKESPINELKPNLTNFYISRNQSPENVFILFVDSKTDITNRVNKMKEIFPQMKFEKVIESSFVDKIMQKLNPEFIKNQDIVIYSYCKTKN